MVYQKTLEYGSSSFQVPAMPNVPPSAKGKRSARKKFDQNRMSAFDMLATVAGNLLSQKEQHPTPEDLVIKLDSYAQKEISGHVKPIEEKKPLKPFEAPVSGNIHRSRIGSEFIFQTHLTGLQNVRTRKSHASCRRTSAGEFTTSSNMNECKYHADSFPRGNVAYPKIQLEKQKTILSTDACAPSFSSLEGAMEVAARPRTFVNSDCSLELALHCNRAPSKSSFPMSGESLELDVDRDDDDNFSGCTHRSTHSYRVFRTKCIDRHVRKLLKSKCQKSTPPVFNYAELSNTYGKMKANFSFGRRRISYKYNRSQSSLFKRKRMFEHYLLSSSRRKVEGSAESSVSSTNRANGALLSSDGPKADFDSGDFHVRLSIKSFKVPELFIEMPENATIGTLKKTVMEAVSAILGGGSRVGVLLQGKKVRDDSKTLRQAGISDVEKLDNLGFTLEPNFTQAPLGFSLEPNSTQAPQQLTVCDNLNLQTTAAPEVPMRHHNTITAPVGATSNPLLNFPLDPSESGHGSIRSSTDVPSQEKSKENLKAITVIPSPKPERPELAQRRIRRPFSVAEVEALVEAVEMLGTGRWRDVKLRAFDNAEYRTYVDLKDKWKTLVHTARIAPQQRRGEPVPQELLDRVLSAHAYWSQQPMKLQSKPPEA